VQRLSPFALAFFVIVPPSPLMRRPVPEVPWLPGFRVSELVRIPPSSLFLCLRIFVGFRSCERESGVFFPSFFSPVLPTP